MSGKNSFGYLGHNFQIKLLNQLIIDKKFASAIIDVMEARYFDNQYFKLIMQMIKEYHDKYNLPPSFDALDQISRIEVTSDMARQNVVDMLIEVRDCPFEDHLWVQEKSLKFCKQQELKKAITKVNKILEDGDFESYDKCESYIREAIQVGEMDDTQIDVFSGLEDVLRDDFREPVPTGITGIDNLLDGGLAKGEIGVFLAPTGVGKSTILTKVANTAYNLGFNVLQIFFDLVGWTAAQGNRTSISSDVVTTDMMGGSIKKAQVGHVIISIAKSLQQKELGLATIAITKSRIGQDGIVFENCKFDNEFLEIDTEQSQTLLDLENNREVRNAQRVRAALDRRNQSITK